MNASSAEYGGTFWFMQVHMKTHRFTLEEQRAFAGLSGDRNPLHTDSMVARRLLFGSTVVHGINSLLWGLDCWLEKVAGKTNISAIRATFYKPIKTGDEIRLSFDSDADSVNLELRVGESLATFVQVKYADPCNESQPTIALCLPETMNPCCQLSEDEIETQSGALDLYLDQETTKRLFPNLFRTTSPLQIAILLATTRLVGMVCPGLNSLYSELNLVTDGRRDIATLKYNVTRFDRRFRLVQIKVEAPGMTGTIKAFVRPTQFKQRSYSELKRLVEYNEYAGQKALIVGGSRGLGEVTAKLLAAGGADIKITYFQGADDALHLVKEIVSNGGTADAMQLDVTAPMEDNISSDLRRFNPTHLYYFATPFIFCGTKGAFSINLFDKFISYYVTGFMNVIKVLSGTGLRNIFYPSSVAIDQSPPDMWEYAAAKTAGETLCKFLEEKDKLKIIRPRLPRMSTDQTASIFPVVNKDPLPIILDCLRSF